MVNKKNKSNKFQLLAMLVPLLFSVLTLALNSVTATALWVISVLCVISFVPVFDKRENLWAFLCVAVTGIPATVCFTVNIMYIDYFFGLESGFFSFLYSAMIYCVIFSIEQIAIGIIIRFFHPKQYKLNI